MKEWSNFVQGELWHSVSSDEKFFAMDAEFFEVHGYPSLFSSRDERSEEYPARRKFFDVPR